MKRFLSCLFILIFLLVPGFSERFQKLRFGYGTSAEKLSHFYDPIIYDRIEEPIKKFYTPTFEETFLKHKVQYWVYELTDNFFEENVFLDYEDENDVEKFAINFAADYDFLIKRDLTGYTLYYPDNKTSIIIEKENNRLLHHILITARTYPN